MFNRRSLFLHSSALATAVAMFAGAGKARAATVGNSRPPTDIEPRGSIGRLERLPELDMESRQDFMQGVTAFSTTGALSAASRDRAAAILATKGLDPTRELPLDEAHALFDPDPVIGLRDRLWHSAHNYEHDLLDGWFRRNADRYLAELATADRAGPGTPRTGPGPADTRLRKTRDPPAARRVCRPSVRRAHLPLRDEHVLSRRQRPG